jgi:hypothetical protein
LISATHRTAADFSRFFVSIAAENYSNVGFFAKGHLPGRMARREMPICIRRERLKQPINKRVQTPDACQKCQPERQKADSANQSVELCVIGRSRRMRAEGAVIVIYDGHARLPI